MALSPAQVLEIVNQDPRLSEQEKAALGDYVKSHYNPETDLCPFQEGATANWVIINLYYRVHSELGVEVIRWHCVAPQHDCASYQHKVHGPLHSAPSILWLLPFTVHAACVASLLKHRWICTFSSETLPPALALSCYLLCRMSIACRVFWWCTRQVVCLQVELIIACQSQ
jgi:hypothetical protein